MHFLERVGLLVETFRSWANNNHSVVGLGGLCRSADLGHGNKNS